MNDSQRKLVIAVAVFVALMLIFPPYRVYGIRSAAAIYETGYGFIFALPHRATVDVATLLAQWVGVFLVGGVGYFLLKNK
jgi:hypothetical protein